jgi:hypothetical protein
MKHRSALDLHDIQGNIVKAYGRYGFPKGRYVLFSVCNGAAGRRFVEVLAGTITTSAPWRDSGSKTGGTSIPEITTNVAFSYHGLRELGVPRASLQTFPDEFAMGMKARRDILGDNGKSSPEFWDPVWTDSTPVDILVSINGRDETCLEKRYRAVVALAEESRAEDGSPGVRLLVGHSGPGARKDLPYQPATALYTPMASATRSSRARARTSPT